MQMAKTREQQGIALLTGCAIAFQGAAIGLAVGLACHIIIGVVKKKPEPSTYEENENKPQ